MRTYRRKPRSETRRGRQLRALELRAQGLSLRAIAKQLDCHHDTVWRDLQKAAQVSDFPVGKLPHGGQKSDGESDSNVVSLSAERFARRTG